MKVHDSSLNSVSIGTHSSGRTEGAQGGAARKAGARDGAGEDRVSLSDLSSMLRNVSGNSPDRSERISRLAALHKSGNYRPDAAAVSKGIVNDALRVG